jgi:hypothetical protein
MVVARFTQPTLLWSSNSHCGRTVRPVNVMTRPVNVMARPVNVMAGLVPAIPTARCRDGWLEQVRIAIRTLQPPFPFDLRRQPVPHRRVANHAAQQQSRARHDGVVAACGFRPTRPTRTHRRLPPGQAPGGRLIIGSCPGFADRAPCPGTDPDPAASPPDRSVSRFIGSCPDFADRPLPADRPQPASRPARPLRLPLHRVLS